MRLKGDARSIDVNMMMYENAKLICKFTEFQASSMAKLEAIEKFFGIASVQPSLETAKSLVPQKPHFALDMWTGTKSKPLGIFTKALASRVLTGSAKERQSDASNEVTAAGR